MTGDIHNILSQYWGYSTFRPLQEDIINSALSGKDTLALLPTGGGKSICFQVPVMARPGIGVVVSPLIALMADQVQNLKKLGIKALALTSALTHREIDMGLDNCVNGQYKFLYLSPERLQSDIVQERLKRMKVNLLVVDEAHCISQWGYDFRPPYLQIAEVRHLLPNIPLMALTATATPRVVDDIQEKLMFTQKHVLQQSFYRPNLYYNVNHTEKKWSKTLEILHKIKGTAIIYVRNRKHTVEVADWLRKNGLSADHYHAGLSMDERKARQKSWVQNETRIMVCTNAFGMGIDKPDVRVVLHLDLPDSLEAYFQEAGRGGRDGQTSYSVILVGPADINELKRRYLETFPDLKFTKRVYQALANFLQIATGMGEGQNYAFDFSAFCKQYDLPGLKTYTTLKVLEKEGLIALNDGFRQPSRLLISVNRTDLYDFQLRNPKLDVFIKTLSRSYGGLDVEYTQVNEALLAARLKTTEQTVVNTLLHLKKQGIVDYIPSKGDAEIIVTKARQSVEYLSISDENLKYRYNDRLERITAVEDFLMDNTTCRSTRLLRYFGEKRTEPCGKCDVCRSKNMAQSVDDDMQKALIALRNYFNEGHSGTINHIKSALHIKETILIAAIRWLVDNGEVKPDEDLYKQA